MSKERKKKLYDTDKTKKLVAASLVAAVAVSVGTMNSDLQEVEASTIYYWNSYSIVGGNEEIHNITTDYNYHLEIMNQLKAEYGASRVSSSQGVNEGVITYYAWVTYNTQKGSYLGKVSSTNRNAYPNEGAHSDGRYYSYSHEVNPNTAPSTPTLTVPTTQFEHGDKHFIGFNSVDAEGNAITYTLEAKYDNESSWTTLYTGTAKTYEYTVPSNKNKIQFRVKASDGSLTSSYATSAEKSIREVMYYWSKFETAKMHSSNQVLLGTYLISEQRMISEVLPNDAENVAYKRATLHSEPSSSYFSGTEEIGNTNNLRVEQAFYQSGYVFRVLSKNKLANYVFQKANSYDYSIFKQSIELIEDPTQKGSLIDNKIQAGFNAYTHNSRNEDGFWYERGQRVLSEDVTPPIIELTEQLEYDASSTINVKTHDLGTVSTVKWAKGERVASYFTSNGTTISGTQTTTGGSFTANTNGVYTVYAVDNKGNATVQTIEVKKVNSAPSTPTLTVPTVQFEHGDKHIFSWNGTDPQNDPLTYTLQASYDDGTWEDLYIGTAKTFEYTVPKDKGANVKFRVVASDGMFSSTSAVSVVKSIREVMYYWSKYSIKNVLDYAVIPGETQSYNYQKPDYMNSDGWTSYTIDQFAFFQPIGTELRLGLFAGKFTPGTVYNGSGNVFWSYTYTGDEYNFTLTERKFQIKDNGYKVQADKLLANNIQAGVNAYTNNAKNSDGYWYIRGQRVLSDDVTPPIIELEEQSEYGLSSTVNVKTHDLGTVSTVKWAAGEQSLSYFTSNGTALSGTQTATGSNFSVNENGTYTVYAVDNKGNAAVQTIEVKKINSAPIVQSVLVNGFTLMGTANKSATVSGLATDVDGQSLTVTATGKNTANQTNVTDYFEINLPLKADDYTNGVHEQPITVKANDGFVDSEPNSTSHIVVKVTDEPAYQGALDGHVNKEVQQSWNKVKHEAFYNAYMAVEQYEAGSITKAAALDKINQLKTATVSTSETLTAWTERVANKELSVLFPQAEQSLSNADYQAALNAYTSVNQSMQTPYKDRKAELDIYHNTLINLVRLETESKKPTGANGKFNENIVNWTTIGEIQAAAKSLSLTTSSKMKNDLNKRITTIMRAYLLQKDTVTGSDLSEIAGQPTDMQINGWYEEFIPAFGGMDALVNDGAATPVLNQMITFVNKVKVELVHPTSNSKTARFYNICWGFHTI